MKQELILIKVGEIALKGLNRRTFEDVLMKNIKRHLAPLGKFEVRSAQSTIYVRPLEEDVDRQLLTQAVGRLEPREREIITLRFGLGGRAERTQKEVADRLGISQSYISRLEKRIIARLRREILSLL